MNIKFVHNIHIDSEVLLTCCRVRTLTGKEIELDIEPDYKVCPYAPALHLDVFVLLHSCTVFP